MNYCFLNQILSSRMNMAYLIAFRVSSVRIGFPDSFRRICRFRSWSSETLCSQYSFAVMWTRPSPSSPFHLMCSMISTFPFCLRSHQDHKHCSCAVANADAERKPSFKSRPVFIIRPIYFLMTPSTFCLFVVNRIMALRASEPP